MGVDMDKIYIEPDKARKLGKAERHALANVFYVIGRTYHDDFPWSKVVLLLLDLGYVPLQEDMTPFQGFFCGDDGEATFPLGHIESGEVMYNLLVMSWHKMPSGRWEVVLYVS